MNGLSVIIPSKAASNLGPCLQALHAQEPGISVRVIDDGIDWGRVEMPEGMTVDIQPGVKPFVYARNVNLGIQAAGTDDVVLLNDDALLVTPGGFSLLRTLAAGRPEFGVLASTCNNVGNPNQRFVGAGLRHEPRMVCFIAVLIPRRTIDLVGLLDERFTGYGLDDDDFCLRVRQAGLKIGIHDGCYVDHGSLTSTFRGMPGAGGDFRPNLELFKQKWGVDNWGHPA